MIDAAYDENDTAYVRRGYERLGYSYLGDTTTSERRNFRMADSLVRKGLAVSSTKIRFSFNCYPSDTPWDGTFILKRCMILQFITTKSHSNTALHANLYCNISQFSMGISVQYTVISGSLKRRSHIIKKELNQAKKANDIYELWWIYRDMSNMYLQLKDTSNAFRNYVLFKKYSDIYISKGNLEGLADAKIRYEADTHNKEVELLSLRLKNNRSTELWICRYYFN